MAAKIFRINYKSDFILTMNSEAGWTIPFCIKFWTSIPSRAYYVSYDGETYTHCAYDPSEPTKLVVQFDDHHLPIGNLHFQIAYHFTVEDFPNNTEDEVFNATAITTEIDGETYQVMLDFTGETAPGIDFNMPSVGVTSVNGKIGAVTLNAEDVGAQPTIEDLATIRNGAAAGATAVQPATLQEGLATKQDTITDLSTIRSGAAAGATAVQPATLQEGLATKQNVIEDLATIRSGAAAGATAVQPAALTPIQTALQTIEAVIPSAASSQNQLADKNFVNSSIATNTANFVGTFETLAELQAVQNPTNNDYGFVIETDAQGNEYYDRYKYVAASQQWLFEYKVESTPFTAAQWAAIQSGITSALVTKLTALPTAQQLSNQLAAKQDTISDLSTIRSGAAAGATAYQKPGTGIPSTDLASAVQTSLERADEAAVRPYNTQSPNGMGYLVLDKEATFASQVTAANTIYEIRYDYDLNGQTITLPAGCILKFDGGSVKNGTITGNDTKIKSESNVIFEGVTFAGSFIGGVDSEWFSIVYGTSYDNSAELNSLLNLAYLSSNKYVKLRYSSTIYVNSVDENLPRPSNYYIGGTVQIKSGVTLDLNSAEIRCITNSNPRYNILYAGKDDTNTNTKNICIKNGSIIGDYGVRTSDSYEQGHGIALLGVDGFVLKNLTIKSCNGDGIFIGANALWTSEDEETDAHKKNRHNQHGKIVQCICDGNKRQGMSIDAIMECDVENCIFGNTSGKAPQSGVDIEPGHASNEVSGVNFKECQYKDNAGSGLMVISLFGAVSDISVEKCISTGNSFDYTISGDSISLLSCNTKEGASVRFYGSTSGCVVKDCFLSNITFQDTSSTPHSTINGIVFNNCDILATTGTGITFVNPLLSLGGVEFNKCSFDWHTTGMTYFLGNADFSKTIDSLLFYDCIFNLQGSAVRMLLYHYDFVKCRFNNTGGFIYIYDGVHNEFVFKDCEILSKTTSYLFLLYSLVAGTSHILSLDNIVLLQGSTQNSGLVQINSYSTQQITLNLANAMSYIRIPRISPSTEASAYTINGTFRYPSLLSGATTLRPVVAVAEGSNFFDTTANKAEWFIGGTWVDATGTAV